jgi:hydrogenase maturation protease
MRSDDAIGMLVVEERAQDRELSSIRCVEGGTLGLDLMAVLQDVTHLLAVDAVDTGAAPGTLVRFGGNELAALPVSKSAHLLGFADLIGALRFLGMPRKRLCCSACSRNRPIGKWN